MEQTPIASGQVTLVPSHSCALHLAQMPLPGAIIFVHGVNSDGEWFDATEEGLCNGLNARLARQKGQLVHGGVEGGQLKQCTYSKELTPQGFIRRTRDDSNFIDPTPAWSPVIRFRWGYKASKEDLRNYGKNVFLNENDYWGGGPFANGCSAIADLWVEGLNDRLFLWLTAQHLNPVASREAYACPPRAYYVHAALRLAKLIESIRSKQADCPITVVCHSQGNMIGIGAAFLADRAGVQADNYVLCNPPLSLLPNNFMESWSQRTTQDEAGRRGRQTANSRTETLKAYFAMLRARAGCEPAPATVDMRMANACPADGSKGYTAQADRQAHGLNGHTYGRVTLYCNPHDQVISASTIQGIGWMGIHANQITATAGAGVFTQRVFAQGYKVGQAPGKLYHYWKDHWRQQALDKSRNYVPATTAQDSQQAPASPTHTTESLGPKFLQNAPPPSPHHKLGETPKFANNRWVQMPRLDFWYPPSPKVRYGLKRGLQSNTSYCDKFTTLINDPLFRILITSAAAIAPEKSSVNAIPDDDWEIPIDAPALPEAFEPMSYSYGKEAPFDAGYDPVGNARDHTKSATNPNDPYDTHAAQHTADKSMTDAALGSEDSESQLRYEDRGRLRMLARREHQVNSPDDKVMGEDEPDQSSPQYEKWRDKHIARFLDEGVNQAATDHSSIVTNPGHAQKAMAYDVAIGVCTLSAADWHELRVEADWRYADSLKTHPHRYLSEYFLTGLMKGNFMHEWARTDPEAKRPPKVLDEREGGKVLNWGASK